MAKKTKKKVPDNKALIAKYAALGAWSVPAETVFETIKVIIKHFLK